MAFLSQSAKQRHVTLFIAFLHWDYVSLILIVNEQFTPCQSGQLLRNNETGAVPTARNCLRSESTPSKQRGRTLGCTRCWLISRVVQLLSYWAQVQGVITPRKFYTCLIPFPMHVSPVSLAWTNTEGDLAEHRSFPDSGSNTSLRGFLRFSFLQSDDKHCCDHDAVIFLAREARSSSDGVLRPYAWEDNTPQNDAELQMPVTAQPKWKAAQR